MDKTDYLLTDSIEITCLSRDTVYSSQEIEHVWQEALNNNPNLFNGTILSMDQYSLEDGQLKITAKPVEYKHYLAQRSGIKLGITPLSVSGLTIFRNSLAVGIRASGVTQYPNCHEFIPSGSIDYSSEGLVDYKQQLLQELKEELNVTQKDILSTREFSLIYDSHEKTYDIGIEIKLSKTGQCRLNQREYSSIEWVSHDQIDPQSYIPTSRKLFAAWSAQEEK